MRIPLLGLGLIYSLGVLAGTPGEVIHLNNAAELAHLRATNPDHYARAERIIAAANRLCRAEAQRVYPARFGASELACDRMLLKTSNPPKRYITFTLDRTRYAALVTVTGDRPRLVAAH